MLLGESVFFPYSPAVSAPLQRTLTAETAAAKKAGLPFKVALIGSPVDLGVVPDLFGHPQKYADFLDQEISFTGHRQPLLVVMAAGYGAQGLSPKATSALASRPPATRHGQRRPRRGGVDRRPPARRGLRRAAARDRAEARAPGARASRSSSSWPPWPA